MVPCLQILGAALELGFVHGKYASTIAPTPDVNMTTTVTPVIRSTVAPKNASRLNIIFSDLYLIQVQRIYNLVQSLGSLTRCHVTGEGGGRVTKGMNAKSRIRVFELW